MKLTRKIPISLRQSNTYKKYLANVVRNKFGNVCLDLINETKLPLRINSNSKTIENKVVDK